VLTKGKYYLLPLDADKEHDLALTSDNKYISALHLADILLTFALLSPLAETKARLFRLSFLTD